MNTSARPDHSPPTRTRWADDRLRIAILTGELAPGARLRAEHLAETYGVSPTPLREAFQRLAGEGLVVIEPQRGARVAPIDARGAVELYDIRLALEPNALKDSVKHSDSQHRDAVADALKALNTRVGSIAEAIEAHRNFHATLLARCTNTRLLTLITQLHDQSERYQIVAAITLAKKPTDADHDTLATAVIAGDARAASAALTRHLTSVREVIERLNANP